jgi:hypothetical protein
MALEAGSERLPLNQRHDIVEKAVHFAGVMEG